MTTTTPERKPQKRSRALPIPSAGDLQLRDIPPALRARGAKLTLQLIDQLEGRIAKGQGLYTAAAALGIGRNTFTRWLKRGSAEIERCEAQVAETDNAPDYNGISLYGYLYLRLNGTRALAIGDAEERVFRDKPETWLLKGPAGRAAGWGDRVEVDVTGEVDHHHTIAVVNPLKELSDEGLLAVLTILEEIGALDMAREQHPTVEAATDSPMTVAAEVYTALPSALEPTPPVVAQDESNDQIEPTPTVEEPPEAQRLSDAEIASLFPESDYHAGYRRSRLSDLGDGRRPRKLADIVSRSW